MAASSVPQHVRYDQSYAYTPTGQHSQVPNPFTRPHHLTPSASPSQQSYQGSLTGSPGQDSISYSSHHTSPNPHPQTHPHPYHQTSLYSRDNNNNINIYENSNARYYGSPYSQPYQSHALNHPYDGASSHQIPNPVHNITPNTMPPVTRNAKLQSLQRLHTTGSLSDSPSATSEPALPTPLKSARSSKTPYPRPAPAPRKKDSLKALAEIQRADDQQAKAAGALPELDIKTRFPPARIKRIMQADEEIGKVAQVTPSMVGKALELFLVSLVSKAAELGAAKGSRRLTVQHVKAAVDGNGQFDFLVDKVKGVGLEGEGATAAPQIRRKRNADGELPEREARAVKKSRENSHDPDESED